MTEPEPVRTQPPPRDRVLAGFHAGLPYGAASLLLGLAFGVLARPLMGPVATVVMSTIVFAGSAPALLADGGCRSLRRGRHSAAGRYRLARPPTGQGSAAAPASRGSSDTPAIGASEDQRR